MKNIHVLPTEKPSRLWINNLLQGKIELSKEILIGSNTAQNIYITSDEEIKSGDWHILKDGEYKGELRQLITKPITPYISAKVILTKDQDLIADGVQAIDDEFLEWFVKNPSCKVVEVEKVELNTDYRSDWKQKFNYEIIISKEEPKQETLEEALSRFKEEHTVLNLYPYNILQNIAEFGAKWQQEKMYSEEESIKKIIDYVDFQFNTNGELNLEIKKWFEQFKKKV